MASKDNNDIIRFDEAHEPGSRKYHEDLREKMSLERNRALQEMAIQLRRDIQQALLREGVTIENMPLHIPPEYQLPVIEALRGLEVIMPVHDMEFLEILAQLEARVQREMKERTTDTTPGDFDLAGYLQRAQSGQVRSTDFNFPAEAVEEVRRQLEEHPLALQIFDKMVDSRAELQRRLELDGKFGHVLNSGAFDYRLHQLDENESCGCYVYVDIVNFRECNNVLVGHDFLDKVVLAPLCEALARSSRLPFVARRGGDEFSVYFPNVTDQRACARIVAEEFRVVFEAIEIADVEANQALLLGPVQEAIGLGKQTVGGIHKILQSLHIKIGVTRRNGAAEDPMETAGRADTNQTKAATRKNDEDFTFPTAIDGEDNVFSAVD